MATKTTLTWEQFLAAGKPGQRWEYTWLEIQRKRRLYRENGVVQVWVDPQERAVEVISPKHGTRTFAAGETVVIEELPGFGVTLFPLRADAS